MYNSEEQINNPESSGSETSYQSLYTGIPAEMAQQTAQLLRKTQIRESNREAARRCRERRRRHIQHLEDLTKRYEAEIETLKEQNACLKKEIIQLRTIVLRNFAERSDRGSKVATVVVHEKGDSIILPVGMSIPIKDEQHPEEINMLAINK